MRLRRLVLVAAAVAVLAVPSASKAQVSLGARVGYAFGFGDVGGDESGTLKMSDWSEGHVPIQVDAMFRLLPGFAVGPYFSYGFGFTGGDLDTEVCDISSVDCSNRIMRLGLQATYSLPAAMGFAPWAGIGTGYEWNKLDIESPGGDGDLEVRGWEIVNLQFGADFATPVVRVGPFVMLSVGRYGEGDASGFGVSGGGDIDKKKLHEWLQIGIRGMFDL